VLIAVAFVAVVLAMYRLPTLAPARFARMAGKISWLLAAGTALGVFLGHSGLPVGVSPAVCVVAWRRFVGARLCRAPDGVDP
jgi:hypothetical protein